MTERRDLPVGAALVVLGPGGLAVARRLKPVLPRARIHGLASRVANADEAVEDVGEHLRRLFEDGVPIIGLCAVGILVRALAPLLTDKRTEPPVVAVAEDGSVAVPILGGHHGANALARTIATTLGGTAAITTAGDVRLGLALDEPPKGWRVGNPEMVKPLTAALISGAAVALEIEAGDAGWLMESGARFTEGGDLTLRVTDHAAAGSGRELVLHPPVLCVGVGAERGVDPRTLSSLVHETLAAHGLSPKAVACLASIDLKADEPAVHALAAELGVPARFFDAPALEAEAPRLLNPSDVVFRKTGCHGVAEGAALAAAGPDGTLVVPKVKAKGATCAVARASRAIDPETVGRGRGALHIVGIGPGAPAWRSPEASAALAAASDVVGYNLYLDLLGEAIAGKTRHATGLGAEEARVRRALDLAAEGRTVALVSSGDSGIYALAAVVFELLDRERRAEWGRLDIDVIPGISALQAAAARTGAPLGHDFCAISLSDLLTPWPEIERRLQAAAAGDFVTVLYNPASKRRRRQLGAARDILLKARAPETPVILARNLGRAGEELEVVRLAGLDPARVDMLTLVLVGNSRTKVIDHGAKRWVYTPRGYAAKTGSGEAGAESQPRRPRGSRRRGRL